MLDRDCWLVFQEQEGGKRVYELVLATRHADLAVRHHAERQTEIAAEGGPTPLRRVILARQVLPHARPPDMLSTIDF